MVKGRLLKEQQESCVTAECCGNSSSKCPCYSYSSWNHTITAEQHALGRGFKRISMAIHNYQVKQKSLHFPKVAAIPNIYSLAGIQIHCKHWLVKYLDQCEFLRHLLAYLTNLTNLRQKCQIINLTYMRLCLEHQHTLNLLPVSMGMISKPSDKKKIENKDFTQPF